MARRTQQFQTIRTEGAILPPDILRRIAALKAIGASPETYHLPPGSKLNESISQSWTSLLTHWQAFQEVREKLLDSDETGTAITNERWLLPLFKELDYGRLITTKSPEIDERVYPIERFYNHTPIHLIGCKLSIDRRTKGARGAATASPHSMVQEYLNRSDDHLWAFLSNGLQLRILRDNISLSRQAFVEFDLESMMEGEVYSDFALLWLLCHQSRVESETPEECWLEKWTQLGKDEGTRVLNNLRLGVARGIEALGRGFIGHPRNDHLREKLHTGTLSTQDFYRQLLRIVYRLLFLFVAEDRGLLHPPDCSIKARDLYDTHYSTRRLRGLTLKIRGSKHSDLWHSLSLVFDALGKHDGCLQLGICGLGSFLWQIPSTANLLGPYQIINSNNVESVFITNDDLLQAVRELAYVEQDRVQRSVDYRNLGSEELGSVYEALLELHPVMNIEARSFELLTVAGNERKITGSYYTPDSLVQSLLDSALDPVVQERLKGKKGENAEKAILDMKVCDPACGSGHFLIAAGHRLARHLARVRTGETEPSPEDYQHALRDVIGCCLYGVDINPMAVELCKVSLWMEAIEPGKPLSFLDYHIQCGNSLLGTNPALLADGILDKAFKPIEGDDREVCSQLKNENKRQRQEYNFGQRNLFDLPSKLGEFTSTFARLTSDDDESVAAIEGKERRYAELISASEYESSRVLADTWCAVFVWKKDVSDLGKICPSERNFREIEKNPDSIPSHVKSEVQRIANQYRFFHWHLAFPDVFRLQEEGNRRENEQSRRKAGFDVMVGNPPWDKIQPEETKFFAAVRPDIAQAKSAKVRKSLIAALPESDPDVAVLWRDHKREIEGISHILKSSTAYPLSGGGNLNLYRSFTELNMRLISTNGRAGIIVQTALATGDTGKLLFDNLMSRGILVRFLDFENRNRFFQDVDIRFRFCLLTMGCGNSHKDGISAQFGWLLHELSEVTIPGRLIELSAADLKLFNPSSQTCPIIISQKELDVTRHLYHNARYIYVSKDDRFCQIELLGELFNLTRASEFFVDVDAETDEVHLRLWEAKYLHQFDHRYATSAADCVIDSTLVEKERASFITRTSKLVAESEVLRRVSDRGITHKWLCGFRRISSGTNERTAIMTVFPLGAVGNTINLVFGLSAAESAILTGNTNAFVFDFTCRQKISGTDVNIWIYKQLPIIEFAIYANPSPWDPHMSLQAWQLSRVLELMYTAWDLRDFAMDCGYSGPPFRWDVERRFLLRCELDASYFHLYLGSPKEWGTGSPQLQEMFPTPRDAVDYIMETFPIVKRKDIKRTAVFNESGEVTTEGTYLTKDTILEIYDEMQHAIDTGNPYQTRLDPQPGPPIDKENNFIALSEWDEKNWPSHIHRQKSN
jgi:hypothetical protein